MVPVPPDGFRYASLAQNWQRGRGQNGRNKWTRSCQRHLRRNIIFVLFNSPRQPFHHPALDRDGSEHVLLLLCVRWCNSFEVGKKSRFPGGHLPEAMRTVNLQTLQATRDRHTRAVCKTDTSTPPTSCAISQATAPACRAFLPNSVRPRWNGIKSRVRTALPEIHQFPRVVSASLTT